MRRTLLLSVCLAGALAVPSAARAAGPGPVACCPVETTFVFREPEYPGASTWDASTFRCRLRSVLVSEDGRFRAGTYTVVGPDTEGGSMVLLCDGQRTLGLQAFAAAIAWEPGGGRLLCAESAADDDLRLFVLDVGSGEHTKRGADRLGYVLGERYDRFVHWAGDSIQVHNAWAPPGEYRWIRLGERKPARR